MDTKRHYGFTIIEVMLFLAVSGALAVSILATSSVAINNQRYRDALTSLQGLIQQQYNETSHVINSRQNDRECGETGVTTKADDSSITTEPRGTSDCLIMGRYMVINGQNITLSDVIGYKAADAPGAPAPNNDLDTLKKYTLFISDADSETAEVAWGGVVDPLPAASPLAILTLRSPLTGVTRTFTFKATQSSTIDSSVLTNDNMAERKLCIDPAAFTLTSRLGVVIRKNAASPSAIEILKDDGGC